MERIMNEYIEKILRDCFHPRKGKPNLKKVRVDLSLVEQHMDKANNNLRAMQKMFDNDLFDWTIICGYYAMYHAVLASLLKIGIRATAHYCAIAAFKEFYVGQGEVSPEYVSFIKKAKHLEEKYADTLEKAQESRIIEQYGIEALTNDDAQWIIEDAKDFVLKIEEVLSEQV